MGDFPELAGYMEKTLHAVVSLLDERSTLLVNGILEDIEKRYGIESVYAPAIPHFSYHVAEDYDSGLLKSILQRFSKNTAEFEIKTTGLGIFPGERPIIYIPIVRSPKLVHFHRTLWQKIRQTCRGVLDYYHPERWMPHITLAREGVNAGNLPGIVELVSRYELNWEISINNISFIYNWGSKQEVRFSLRLKRQG